MQRKVCYDLLLLLCFAHLAYDSIQDSIPDSSNCRVISHFTYMGWCALKNDVF